MACTVLHHTSLQWTAHYIIALLCTALQCTKLNCTEPKWTELNCYSLHCTELHCFALHCTALLYNSLHCTALHWTTMYCISQNYAEQPHQLIPGLSLFGWLCFCTGQCSKVQSSTIKWSAVMSSVPVLLLVILQFSAMQCTASKYKAMQLSTVQHNDAKRNAHQYIKVHEQCNTLQSILLCKSNRLLEPVPSAKDKQLRKIWRSRKF